MHKLSLLVFTVIFIVGSSFLPPPSPNTKPVASIKLSFLQENGTHASSVAYNTKHQLYYAAIGGNPSFPLEVFDKDGNNVYQTETGIDLRGLWYNEKKDRLEGNSPGEDGFFYINLDGNGYPLNKVYEICDDVTPPDFQSLAVSDGKNAYYYYGGEVRVYSINDECEYQKTIDLTGFTLNTDNVSENCLIWTGEKKYEIGLLDAEAKLVYLFNKKGKYSTTIKLPATAITYDWFKFSYSNGHVFLYDVDRRAWKGYKIF